MAIILFDNGAGNKILTSSGLIATSTDCCCDGSEIWNYCDDDTFAAYLDFDHTDVDYAWLCISGLYEKAYNAGSTTGTATNPTVLKQCGTTASTCSDLVGWPATDYFNAIDCSSSAVGDVNWSVRWQSNPTVVAISSGSLIYTKVTANVTSMVKNNATRSGDFDFRLNVTNHSTDASGQPAGGEQEYVGLVVNFVGGGQFAGYFNNRNSSGIVGYYMQAFNNSTSTYTATTGLTGEIRVARVGSTITVYIKGVSRHSGTLSADVETVEMWFRGGTRAFTATVSQITIEDGSSNDIIIDPTGTACV